MVDGSVTRTIADIMRRPALTAAPSDTLAVASASMREHNAGAVVGVDDTGRPIGILTERDVLRLGATGPESLSTTRVADAMTAQLVVGVAEDLVDYAAGIMTANRIRHLPIVEGERLTGVVSIGDIVNAMKQEKEVENRYLRDYIQGSVR